MHEPHSIENPTTLISGNFLEEKDPYALFLMWYKEAQASEINDPNAMTLATVDAEGFPNARIVLLKDISSYGFTFYTNTMSAKGAELAVNPVATLVFHWKSLRKQVRIRGIVAPVTSEEADTYFASRARESQIGAWASQQSQPLESRQVFDDAVAEIDARFTGKIVPRPAHWSGYRVSPRTIEFWHDRPFRLHDRAVYSSENNTEWKIQRLYP